MDFQGQLSVALLRTRQAVGDFVVRFLDGPELLLHLGRLVVLDLLCLLGGFGLEVRDDIVDVLELLVVDVLVLSLLGGGGLELRLMLGDQLTQLAFVCGADFVDLLASFLAFVLDEVHTLLLEALLAVGELALQERLELVALLR